MKVKLLFVFILIVTSIRLNAQESKNTCNFDYAVNAEKNPEGLNFEDRFVNFKWEISKLSQKEEVSIEIVKIFDCFKAIEGNQLEAYTFLNLKKEALKDENSFKILLTTLGAKCFKWRVVLKSDKCIEQTDWKYYSFLD